MLLCRFCIFYIIIWVGGLCWVFTAVLELSLVVLSRCYPSLRCVGFSRRWLLFLQRAGSGHMGSVLVVYGPSCPVACGILVPQPGVKPVSPTLAGGFFATGLPTEIPLIIFFLIFIWLHQV